jgi:Mg2+ and Co2+ transporter CorA
MMAHEGHLLLVLHEVPEPGVPERKGILFWRDPKGEWKTNERGSGKAVLRELLQRYATRVDDLEAAYAAASTASTLFPVMRAITPIVRACKHLHETLQAAREQVRLDKDIINARDAAGEVERAAELLSAEARNALDFEIAEAAEAQTKLNGELAVTGQRLNMLAAIFLPLTAIGSLFGMNMPHGLERVGAPALFWGVAIVGIIIGLVLRGSLGSTPERTR